ncbi:CotH kinase family protein [Nocardiopsis changdeensis]|uniref:CotH kinase family protein n=1 Tax=Nocardiopsis changdeensis TaxID=2831969 RepID=A0ABX8BS33_9ACTN|nr:MULTISPECIES: CotH kinase family protein [Nocardiopsis]QUX24866.1 CotH kinase family protein [Nocardiopsis changdeensis]QYX35252.1 CotH kinase family protein [Nocardiopsis sp. MT53]
MEAEDTAAEGAAPRPRLRHRIPARLRHHGWRAAVLAAGLVAVLLLLAPTRITPYVTSAPVPDDGITEDIEGTADLFADGSHTIEVTFDEQEYAEMMDAFQEEGEKEYIRADIVIDGTGIEDVGLRLKGNSTLMGLRGGGREEEEGAGGGPGGVALSEDAPEDLPWLISFDEYAEGRAYQGHTELALRPAASGSDTALNEALALELTEAAGQTTQDHTVTSFTVNGEGTAVRLLLDHPDAAWAAGLGDGVLYKGRAGGSFDYLGEDPTEYEDAFKQVNAEGAYDLTPVMELLRFVDEADDAEFAEELDGHLDVESFARHLALQDLVSNTDGMDGPGNNYYLWYDLSEERFTVLSWDLNLAFGGMGGGGPTGGGGGGTPEGTEAPQGTQPPAGMEFPEGMEPPEGMGLPEGAEPPEGVEPPQGGFPGGERGEGGGMSMGGSGALKERFLADAGFEALYESAYADLYAELVGSGTAADLLAEVTARAEEAGDTTAAEVSAGLAERLEAITAELSADTGLPGTVPGGSAPAAPDTGG